MVKNDDVAAPDIPVWQHEALEATGASRGGEYLLIYQQEVTHEEGMFHAFRWN